MAATIPTTPREPDVTLEELDARRAFLKPLAASALKETLLKSGVQLPEGITPTKPNLIIELARHDAAMRVAGYPGVADAPPAAEVTPGAVALTADVECDEEGYPLERDDVARLDDDHLDTLIAHQVVTFLQPNPQPFPGRDEKVAWLQGVAYEEPTDAAMTGAPLPADAEEPTQPAAIPGQITVDDVLAEVEGIIDGKSDADAAMKRLEEKAHIPTAAPKPRTVAAPCEKCSGNGGWEVDGGFESCEACENNGAPAGEPQLTLFPGGEKPTKSVLNIGSLRHDLGAALQFDDGARVLVSFEVEVDKIAFIPEKSGGDAKRRVRTHAGAIDLDTVSVTLAS